MTKSNPASVHAPVASVASVSRKLLKSLVASVSASVHASVGVGFNKPLKRLVRRFCVGCVGGPPIPLYAPRRLKAVRGRNEKGKGRWTGGGEAWRASLPISSASIQFFAWHRPPS
jgi:hypothetical protein